MEVPVETRCVDRFHLAATSAAAADALCDPQAEVLRRFDEMRDRLLRYSVGFGIAMAEAEDVTQEAFLALYRHLRAGRSRENIPGWLFRTVHHLSLKRRARLQMDRMPATGHDAPAEQTCAAPGPEELLLQGERQQKLSAVMRALPELDQACLRLRAEGCRYREIAATLGISLASVSASLARSMAKLSRVDAR